MRLYLDTDRKDFPDSRLATLTHGKKLFITGACHVEYDDDEIRTISYLILIDY
jgi:hypothetical protein